MDPPGPMSGGVDPIAHFRALLRNRANASATERDRIDAELERRYQRERAVVITDLSGFTRITRARGILHFLSLAQTVHACCEPIVASHNGVIVKTIGDDLMVSFPDPTAAVHAALAMSEAAREAPSEERVLLSAGVAWGPIFDVGGRDLFGDAVNIASKLGEDLAAAGEVLVAVEVAEAAPAPAGWHYEARKETVSGIELAYCALVAAG